MREKGITTTALVITIIVILILAGIIITFAINSGIIGQADSSQEEADKIKEYEELSLAVADYWIMNGDLEPIKLSNFLVASPYNYTIKNEEAVDKDTEQLKVLVRKFIFDVTTEPEGDITDGEDPIGPGGIIEIIEDNVVLASTTSSVTVTVTDVNVVDPTYRYYISTIPGVYESYIETSRPTHTFEYLTQDTQYYVKVEITDADGNTGTIEDLPIKTNKVPDVDPNEIMYSNAKTNKNVSITSIHDNSEFQLMYKIGDGAPVAYNEAIILEYNGKVTFWLEDSTGQKGGEYVVNINCIDRNAPKITNIIENGSLLNVLIDYEDNDSRITKIAAIRANATKPLESMMEDATILEVTSETIDENGVKQTIALNDLYKNYPYFFWAMDEAGNISEEYYLYCTADLEMREEIYLSTEEMTNTSITAEFPLKTGGITTEYIILNSSEDIKEENLTNDKWTAFVDDYITIDDNCVILYRYNFFNTKYGDYKIKEVTNIDKTKPTIKQIGSSIYTATVRMEDTISGVDKIAWTGIQATPSEWHSITENTFVIPFDEGIEKLYVYVRDKVGNETITTVYAKDGFDIRKSNIGYETADVRVEAKDERINELGTDIYWYLGYSETPPTDLEEYTKVTYEADALREYKFENGKQNELLYLHVWDNNYNGASSTIRFDKKDKTAPTVAFEIVNYYQNNEAIDVKITIEDEESAIEKISLYNSDGSAAEYIEIRDGVVYLCNPDGTEFMNFPAADGFDLSGIIFEPQTDSKKVVVTFPTPPKEKLIVSAMDIMDNESEKKEFSDEGDTEKPVVSFSKTKYYKNDESKLINANITIEDAKSGLNGVTITYIDSTGNAQTITKTAEELAATKSITIPVTGILHETNLTVVATDICLNLAEETFYVEGDYEPPKPELDNSEREFKSGTNSIMYVDNSIINIYEYKSAIAAYSIQYTDNNGITQTISEDGLSSTEEDRIGFKSVTLNNVKPNTVATIYTKDICDNEGNFTLTIGSEKVPPDVDISRPRACDIDANGNYIINVFMEIKDEHSGLVSYELSYTHNGQTTLVSSANNLGGVYSIEEQIFSVPNGSYVHGTATDICGNIGEYTSDFLIDKQAPAAHIIPEKYVVEAGNNLVKGVVEISDICGFGEYRAGVSLYKVVYVEKNGTEEKVIVEADANGVHDVSVNFSVPDGSTIKVTAQDRFGNVMEPLEKLVEDTSEPGIWLEDKNISYQTDENGKAYATNAEISFVDYFSLVEAYTIEYVDRYGKTQTVEKANIDLQSTTYVITDFKIDSKVYVTAVDNFGNTGTAEFTIGLENNKPDITINQTFRRDENGTPFVDVIVTISDSQSGLDEYSIKYGADENSLQEYKKETNLGGLSTTGAIKFSVKNKTLIKVEAVDYFDNQNSVSEIVGDLNNPSVTIEPVSYYKHTNGQNYIIATVSISDNASGDSGLYGYKISYAEAGQEKIVYENMEGQLDSDKQTKTVGINVPNNSEIFVVATDMVDNETQSSKIVSDLEGPTCNSEPSQTYNAVDGKAMISGTILVTDDKSGVYQYQINDREWETLDAAVSEFEIPFDNILDGEILTITAKDLFGNERIVFSKTLQAEHLISIKNVVVNSWNPEENKVASGTVDIEFIGQLEYCALTDLEGNVIKNRTNDVKGKLDFVTIDFENMDNSFKIVVRNDFGQEHSLEIGDTSAPEIDKVGDAEGIIKTPYTTASGDAYFNLTIYVTDRVQTKEIIEGKEETSKDKEFNGSGLSQYKIIIDENDSGWKDIPLENEKPKQDYAIEINSVSNASSLTVIVKDIMGNESTVFHETVQLVNDITIENINITEWDSVNGLISGTVDISALEKGLNTAEIRNESNIVSAPQNYNGSRQIETVTFSNIPNTSEIFVTNMWGDENSAPLGDTIPPVITMGKIEFKVDNTDNNKGTLAITDNGAGLDVVEIIYLDSDENEVKKIKEAYDGTDREEIELVIPNSVSKIKVTASDKIGNVAEEIFEPEQFSDKTPPTITINQESIAYTVEGDTCYISGEITITDEGSGITSYKIVNVIGEEENILDSAENISEFTTTKTFKIPNDSIIAITATDAYNNSDTTQQHLVDNTAPSIKHEEEERYRDEYYQKDFIKIKFNFEDTQSGLASYSIINQDDEELYGGNFSGTEQELSVEFENNTTIKVIAIDKFGNENSSVTLKFEEDEETFPEKDLEIPDGPEAIYEPTEWNEGPVTVTLEEDERFTLYYKINDGADQVYKGPFTVSSNCIIKTRYYYAKKGNSGNETATKIGNIDLEKPVVTIESRDMKSVYFSYIDDVSGVIYIAITETPDEPSDYDWELTSLNVTQGILSDRTPYTGLEFGKTYYAWAKDASGKVSEPVEFSTNIRDVAPATHTPTEITNGSVTVTLPKDSRLNTQYQIVYTDEEFNEENEWLTYSTPFVVEENATIYYRYEFAGTAGDCRTHNITNIDKVGPQIDFAIMIDETLNLEYTEENKILGYAVKAENVTPTQYELKEYIQEAGVTSFSITGLQNIEIDKTYYVWLADEAGNVSETPVAFKKVKVAPTNLIKGYTKDAVPLEIYVENVDQISLGIKYDAGVNEEIRAQLEGYGYVEGAWMPINDTDNTDTITQQVPISCTVLFKATKGEKTSKEYEVGVHMIDLELPTAELLEKSITDVKFKVKDEKVGIIGLAIQSQTDGLIYEKYFIDIDNYTGTSDLYNMTEAEQNAIPNEWTSETVPLVPNQNYVLMYVDAFEHMGQIEFNTMIPKPEGGTIYPTEYTADSVKVTLPKSNIYETEYRLVTSSNDGEWITYTDTFEVFENCSYEYRYKFEHTTDSGTQEYFSESAILKISNIDKNPPILAVTSSNSYSVRIGLYDAVSGVTGYYISTDEATPKAEDFIIKNADGISNQFVYWIDTSLSKNQNYYVWAIDKVGNISAPVTFETVIKRAEGATVSETEWTNKDITVTLPKDQLTTTNTEYQIISADEVLDETATWTRYTAPFKVSENCVVYYRYNDGVAAGEYGTLNITNIDKVKPTFDITAILMDGTVNLNWVEQDSGIAGYIASTSSTGNYLYNLKASDLADGKITGLAESKTYYIWIVDNADNISESYAKITTGTYTPKVITEGPIAVTLPKLDGYTLQYQIDATLDDGWTNYTTAISITTNCAINYRYVKGDIITNVITFNINNILSEETVFEREGVNTPKLSDGMIPIKYNGTNWVVCNKFDDEWYNYTDQAAGVDGTSKWANVMLSDGYYKADTVKEGTIVQESQLGSMFVWIPRYAYAITEGYHTATSSGTSGTIKIAFLRGTNQYSTGDTIEYSYQGTKGEAILVNASGSGNWNEHPAFTFGDKTVAGIWFAKFQASMSGSSMNNYATKSKSGYYGGTSEVLKIQPSVSIWRYITVGDAFDICYNMNKASNNVYGISTNKNDTDPHLTKNIEWGAMTYLTQSSYGRNGNKMLLFPKTDTSVTASVTNNRKYLASTGTTTDATYSALTYITAPYTSSTGNITGIYDIINMMSDTVAAYLDNGHSNTNGASMENADSKYADIYSVAATDSIEDNYEANKDKYGDAIYELTSDYVNEGDSSGCNTTQGRRIWGTSTIYAGYYMALEGPYLKRNSNMDDTATTLQAVYFDNDSGSIPGSTTEDIYEGFMLYQYSSESSNLKETLSDGDIIEAYNERYSSFRPTMIVY